MEYECTYYITQWLKYNIHKLLVKWMCMECFYYINKIWKELAEFSTVFHWVEHERVFDDSMYITFKTFWNFLNILDKSERKSQCFKGLRDLTFSIISK